MTSYSQERKNEGLDSFVADLKRAAQVHNKRPSAGLPHPPASVSKYDPGKRNRSGDMSEIIQNLKNFRKNRRYHQPSEAPKHASNRSVSNPRSTQQYGEYADEELPKPTWLVSTQGSTNAMTDEGGSIAPKQPVTFSDQEITRIYSSSKSKRVRGKVATENVRSSSVNGKCPLYVARILGATNSNNGLPNRRGQRQSTNIEPILSAELSSSTTTGTKRAKSCARASGSFNNSKRGERAVEAARKIEADRLGHTNVIPPNDYSVTSGKLGSSCSYAPGTLSKELRGPAKKEPAAYGRNGVPARGSYKRSERSLNMSVTDSQKMCKSSTEQSFGMGSMLQQDSTGMLQEQRTIEEVHYFLVSFHQHTKEMLKKVEEPDTKPPQAKQPESSLLEIAPVEDSEDDSDLS